MLVVVVSVTFKCNNYRKSAFQRKGEITSDLWHVISWANFFVIRSIQMNESTNYRAQLKRSKKKYFFCVFLWIRFYWIDKWNRMEKLCVFNHRIFGIFSILFFLSWCWWNLLTLDKNGQYICWLLRVKCPVYRSRTPDTDCAALAWCSISCLQFNSISVYYSTFFLSSSFFFISCVIECHFIFHFISEISFLLN